MPYRSSSSISCCKKSGGGLSPAALSRAVAGTLGLTIAIALPGSRKAVSENLAAVLPALGHALDKLHGDPSDCGRA